MRHAEQLVKAGVIDDRSLEVIQGLRDIRNELIHERPTRRELHRESAEAYIGLVDELLAGLEARNA